MVSMEMIASLSAKLRTGLGLGLALVGLLWFCANGFGDSATTSADLTAYLAQLELQLNHIAQRANQPAAWGTSVVGLRGSKQEPVSKQLYWKGKKTSAPESTDEIRMFRTALDLAKAGQRPAALATLKSFEEKYPKSSLRSDADETIQRLSVPVPALQAVTNPPVEPLTTVPAKS